LEPFDIAIYLKHHDLFERKSYNTRNGEFIRVPQNLIYSLCLGPTTHNNRIINSNGSLNETKKVL
jgi:hypothetical protein